MIRVKMELQFHRQSLAVAWGELIIESMEKLCAIGGNTGDVRLWVKECLLRSQFRLNTLPQDAQLYGFMSVCVSRWVFKLDLWLNDLEQTGHLWGDSSRCRILCTASVLDWQKPLPHSPHLKGFSLLWMYLKQKK